MRVKSLLTVGFLSMLAATAGVSSSVSFAAEAQEKVQRVDVIDRLPETGVQADSSKTAGEKVARVDVIESIGSGGPTYAYHPKSMRVDVIDSIESGGPSYAYTKSLSH